MSATALRILLLLCGAICAIAGVLLTQISGPRYDLLLGASAAAGTAAAGCFGLLATGKKTGKKSRGRGTFLALAIACAVQAALSMAACVAALPR